MRGIAARAGIAESTVFRHFQDKSELFESAVVTPFEIGVEEFSPPWRAEERRPGPTATPPISSRLSTDSCPTGDEPSSSC